MMTTAIGWFLVATLPPTVDLTTVRRQVESTWCPSCPGARFRLVADFQMQVDHSDPALGVGYFPQRVRNKQITNLLTWSETTARAGDRYKMRLYEPPDPSSRQRPGINDDVTRLFDGRESWTYRPFKQAADREPGITQGTQVVQDYYGDMVGLAMPPGPKPSTHRLTIDPDAVFDLRAVVASGTYEVAGAEVVNGEPCTILERPGWDRLWLAENKGGTIVRRERNWLAGGPRKRRITNGGFVEVAPGAWLPTRGKMEIYGTPATQPNIVVGTLVMTAHDLQGDITDSEFTPDLPRGTRVTDFETMRNYRFGQETGQAMQTELDRTTHSLLAYRPTPWWRRPWAIASGVVLLGLGIVFGLQRRWTTR